MLPQGLERFERRGAWPVIAMPIDWGIDAAGSVELRLSGLQLDGNTPFVV